MMMDDNRPSVMMDDDRTPAVVHDNRPPMVDDNNRFFNWGLHCLVLKSARQDRRGCSCAGYRAEAHDGGDNAIS